MLVDASGHGLQLQRQAPLAQQLDSSQASLIRTRYLGQRLISLFGSTVQRNLDGKRRPFQQIIGNLFRDKGAVGEEGNQKSLLLGVGINFQKILAGEDFPAGVEQPEA